MDGHDSKNERSTARARALLLALSIALLVFACAVSGSLRGPQGPQQEWSADHGPVVPHDSFPRDCSLCHAGGSWHAIKKDFRFDHAKETGVPLEGAHARAECLRCHNDRGPVAVFAAQGCSGCHEDVHRGRLGLSCTDCHGETTWKPEGEVARHAKTRFPLVGSHSAVTCERCHAGATQGNFDRTSTLCQDCHAADLARATSPDHAAQGWVDGCQRCHASTTWGEGGFTHSAYPLTGAHASAACEQCHAGGIYQGAPTNCAGCHTTDYDATLQPPHAAAGFSTACETCHTTSGWTPSSFDHSGFPLTGAHVRADCSACHAGGVYGGLPQSCVACHQSEYDGTTQPDHAAANLPTTCEQCHTTVAWTRATFDHAGVTRNCVQCHTADYNATSTPNHAAAGFPTTCQTCHTTTHWTPSTFDHATFPLTGAHVQAACSSCHAGGVYRGTPSACSACHLSDYQQTTTPNHASSGYPTTCEQCHNTVAWQRANFDHAGVARGCQQCHEADYLATTSPPHAATGYPRQCQQCHGTTGWTPANFNHAGVTRSCATCHLQDYDGTNSPNHAAAGFPTTCQTCHDTDTWDGATFNHSDFPINSGDHDNLTCAQCHPNPRNYGQFTCVSCHAHSQSEMAGEHDDVTGYSWNSNACYSCHPNGDADD
ncbi:MAG: hypothetical protein IPJ77_06285 [Planctomycetes bacterium]|nr:hypothetical protein [Planctomycetota bacterium]